MCVTGTGHTAAQDDNGLLVFLLLLLLKSRQCVKQGQAIQQHKTIMDCLFACCCCCLSPGNVMCVTGTGHAAASDDNGLLVCLFVCCMLLFCKVLAMQCVSQGQATHSSR